MAFGLLSVDWNSVLSAYKVQQPQTEIELIIDTIWEDICEPLWNERNHINNGGNSYATIAEMKNLRLKLQWYHEHQDEVFNYRHRYLVSFDVGAIEHMKRNAMVELVSQLEAAYEYHDNERKQCLQFGAMPSTTPAILL